MDWGVEEDRDWSADLNSPTFTVEDGAVTGENKAGDPVDLRRLYEKYKIKVSFFFQLVICSN